MKQERTRREFFILAGQVVGGLALVSAGASLLGKQGDERSLSQILPASTPEATEDPFAEADAANTEALRDVEFGDKVSLFNPRIVGVADVRVIDVPLGDRFDVYMQMGILATKNEVIGLVRNIDECLVEGWEENEIMNEPEEVRDGVRLALVDERVESIDAEVTIPKLPAVINDVEYELPLLSANEVVVNGEGVTCPSVTGRVAGFLEDAVRSENLRGLGNRVGEALGALVGGAIEGFERGRGN